jgi:DTW domain-containing protein
MRDPAYFPVLLYPGRMALNLSELDQSGPRLTELSNHCAGRSLLVFVLDATWALGKKMLKLSPGLQRLPRIMFTPSAPSRYVIKQQPHPSCLSTLEATHELLLALESAGLDSYPLPDQLLALFTRMQDFQLKCAADSTREGYRRSAYSQQVERVAPQGRSGARRTRVFSSLL